ncbi:MAG: BNR-4 repeat-containing protein [Chitinophagaceae bacterium]
MKKNFPGKYLLTLCLIVISSGIAFTVMAQKTINVGEGWANNSVNTVVFRRNSLASFGDTQYISYYDKDSYMVVGKRKLGSKKWILQRSTFKGNTSDAHNTISMIVDGTGYLHLSWDHHGNPLRYCKSLAPGSLQMTNKLPMTGSRETNVTYPEFHRLPNGNLVFLYRDGQSGQGNLVINQYDVVTQQWKQLHSNLIDGEKQRNAYWQACVDTRGTIHISWVWRESPDVSSNHDLCYAKSVDGGLTWEKSTGEKYSLPINASTAEYVSQIPQKSELINQTSMYADEAGNPFIATYWREKGDSIPQYHVVYSLNGQWHTQNLGFRKTPFSLSGTGSKRIPMSRPQIVSWTKGGATCAALIFRDEERGSLVSVAITTDIIKNKWKVKDLSKTSVGSWEPSFDTELWKQKKWLHLFVEYTEQIDGEGKANIPPQMVQVLEWKVGD